ncbi:amidohydrolase [Streptomyces sp. CC53]|uniref:amidohydrolase n=1 Tax=unclassified Streptomyces TaxID=2593676 RepID=UPI0008DCA911|nr:MULTISPECIES: amidohydrolase [unclassified Streptomyces]OII64425.1 amidohydrolase [Streptomyces sp. CC53]
MAATHPDLVFVNGRVLTVDARFSVASALAVTGGAVSAVGDRREVMAAAGPGTRVVDLAGGTLLPGINDAHLHGCAFGMTRPPLSVDLAAPGVRSIADVAEAVRAAAERTPPGEWVFGHGWDPGVLRECAADPERLPDRYDLDAVSPDRPVLLYAASGHATWVNSAAMAAAGVPRGPGGGAVPGLVADARGVPTGLFQEGAQELVHRALPPLSARVRAEALRAALRTLARLGVTSFTEPGLGPGGDALMRGALAADTLDVYGRLLADGELTARVGVLWLPAGMAGTVEEFVRGLDAVAGFRSPDPRRLAVHGVKVFADGIPLNRTSWMHEEYVGGGFGCLCVGGDSDEERSAAVAEMVRHGHEAGHQLGVHVTGDRAIDTVVDAFAAAAERHPRPDPRHYAIHGDFLTARSMRTLARHGFGVNMNPTIKWAVADVEEHFVGPERAAYEWPYRDALDAGVRVTSGSDAPVTFPDWRQGVSTMMLRESRGSGRVSGADQCISLREALRTYTADAAWQDFAEGWKGSLEVGKAADLCVVGGDLLSADPHDIPGMPVVFTAVGGEVVHDELGG